LGRSEAKLARIVSVAVSLAMLYAGMNSFAQAPDATDSATVTQALLLDFLADNSTFTLIDARSPEEYAESHIANAINIPHDAVDRSPHLLPTDHQEPIVVYCKSGKRAALLQTTLTDFGYTDVRVLKPQQIHWFDDMAVFNCGVPVSEDSPDQLTTMLNKGKMEEKE
jgi:phage shock protein E